MHPRFHRLYTDMYGNREDYYRDNHRGSQHEGRQSDYQSSHYPSSTMSPEGPSRLELLPDDAYVPPGQAVYPSSSTPGKPSGRGGFSDFQTSRHGDRTFRAGSGFADDSNYHSDSGYGGGSASNATMREPIREPTRQPAPPTSAKRSPTLHHSRVKSEKGYTHVSAMSDDPSEHGRSVNQGSCEGDGREHRGSRRKKQWGRPKCMEKSESVSSGRGPFRSSGGEKTSKGARR